MQYTLTFLEEHYNQLTDHLFSRRDCEQAAYLLCAISTTDNETRLLVNTVLPVGPTEIENCSETHITIKGISYTRAMKRASQTKRCFVLVHSHPAGVERHSGQDDVEEPKLFRTAYNRIRVPGVVHASLVLSDKSKPVGRAWLENGQQFPIDRIRVLGKRFHFYDLGEDTSDITVFDRQVLAFGPRVQHLFKRLSVGIIGLGGTGSAVAEQLIRLGIGHIIACDPQTFDKTNINRVYGSRVADQDSPKTALLKRLADDIGLGTVFDVFPKSITDLETAKQFRKCDVLFGCTDDEWGRSILTKLALSYFIPVFDMGVLIDSREETIKSVRGRVTTLLPGSPCLFCRGIIDTKVVSAEIKHQINPEEYEQLKREGYVPGLPGNAPSVIMFTSMVASAAITELLHRITGLMGKERSSTEVILRIDESRVSTNTKPLRECWCADTDNWGEGDVDPFLNLTWVQPANEAA